jgi:hypothetical protein
MKLFASRILLKMWNNIPDSITLNLTLHRYLKFLVWKSMNIKFTFICYIYMRRNFTVLVTNHILFLRTLYSNKCTKCLKSACYRYAVLCENISDSEKLVYRSSFRKSIRILMDPSEQQEEIRHWNMQVVLAN